jgi:hypothetical protein
MLYWIAICFLFRLYACELAEDIRDESIHGEDSMLLYQDIRAVYHVFREIVDDHIDLPILIDSSIPSWVMLKEMDDVISPAINQFMQGNTTGTRALYRRLSRSTGDLFTVFDILTMDAETFVPCCRDAISEWYAEFGVLLDILRQDPSISQLFDYIYLSNDTEYDPLVNILASEEIMSTWEHRVTSQLQSMLSKHHIKLNCSKNGNERPLKSQEIIKCVFQCGQVL